MGTECCKMRVDAHAKAGFDEGGKKRAKENGVRIR